MRRRQIGVIARREYAATVKRREFILITLGLPIFYVFLIALVGIVTGSSMKSGESARRSQSVRAKPPGFFDESGLLDKKALMRVAKNQPTPLLFASVEAGKKAVQAEKIRVLVSIGKDFAKDGRIVIYQPPQKSGVFSEISDVADSASVWEPRIKRALLAGKVPPNLLTPLIYPLSARTLTLDKETGAWEKPDPLRFIGRLAVPYLFSLLLIMAVMFSTSYLMHSIVEEKENRIIEVLLSSTTHEELLAGKIVGLGAVGLTQLAVWVSGAVGTLLIAASLVPASRAAFASATPAVVGVSVLMFLLGFGLYAAIMAGVGAMGTSWRESQQTAGFVALPLTVPLWFLVALLDAPDGMLARVLSFIPFTAPIALMLRVSAGGATIGEVALSSFLLILSIWGVILLSARLFRLSLLLTGQRPGLAQVARALFVKSAGGG